MLSFGGLSTITAEPPHVSPEPLLLHTVAADLIALMRVLESGAQRWRLLFFSSACCCCRRRRRRRAPSDTGVERRLGGRVFV